MRWVSVTILAYLLVLVQTSFGHLLFLDIPHVGPVGPDLLAILAVYIALHGRTRVEVMLAAWILGLALDLTTGAGAVVPLAVGPMSIAYALVAGVVFGLREMVFRDNVITQCVMGLLFVLTTHVLWVSVQWIVAYRQILPWSVYPVMLLQAGLVAIYTGVLMPIGYIGLRRIDRWLILPGSSARRRRP